MLGKVLRSSPKPHTDIIYHKPHISDILTLNGTLTKSVWYNTKLAFESLKIIFSIEKFALCLESLKTNLNLINEKKLRH